MSRIEALKEIVELCGRIRLSDSKANLLGVLSNIQEIAEEEVKRYNKGREKIGINRS